MTIICVPFDTEVFWTVLAINSIIAALGILYEVARMHQGINPRRLP